MAMASLGLSNCYWSELLKWVSVFMLLVLYGDQLLIFNKAIPEDFCKNCSLIHPLFATDNFAAL
jgi:hypothetical protein